MRFTYAILFVLSSALLLTGCREKAVVVVNDEAVTEKEVQWYIWDRLGEHRDSGIKIDAQSLRHSVLQQMVAEKLLAQGARSGGLSVSEQELAARVEAEKKRLGAERFAQGLRESGLSEAAFRKLLKDVILAEKFTLVLLPDEAVSEQEIVDYYRQRPIPFIKPETFLVRIVYSASEEGARSLVGRIRTSGFDAVADGLVGDASYKVSPGYEWTDPNINPPDVSRAIKRTKVGGWGGPYKAGSGYILLSVKEHRKEGIKSLEEAKGEIRELLISQKRGAAVVHWVAEKRKGAKISID